MSTVANLVLTADASAYLKEVDAAMKKTQEAGAKMGDVAQKAAGATQTLTQEYRSAFKESQRLAQQFGTTSTQAIEAAAAAGKYKNQLDDVKQITQALSSDTPVFTATIGVLHGLAGAASVAAGGMALLGVKSEEVQQMMLKVQGAIALTQGLQAIGGLKDAFLAFATVLKTEVIPSLITVQGLLVGGLVVGGIAAVLGLAQAYSEASDNAEKLANSIKDAEKAQQDFSASILNATDKNLKLRQYEISLMKDGVEKEKALAMLKRDQIELTAKKEYEASQKTYFDTLRFNRYRLLAEEEYQNKLDDIRNKYAAKPIKRKDLQQSFSINGDIDLTPPTAPTKKDLYIPYTVDQQVTDRIKQLGQAAQTAANQAFTGLGETIGKAIAGGLSGGDPFEALGQLLFQSFGALLETLGSLYIAFGVQDANFKASLVSGNPFGMIAAGVALVALGAAIKTATSNMAKAPATSGGGGGGSYATTSAPSAQAQFNPAFNYQGGTYYSGASGGGQLSTVWKGNDMYIFYKLAAKQRNRL